MVHTIYVGTYTNDVYTLSFNPDTQSLAQISSLTVGHHPSWLTPDPSDPSIIYTGLEQTDGKILAIRYGTDGKGAISSEQSSLGRDPCTLVASGSTLFVGNYSSSNLTTLPISAGLVAAGKISATFSGSGPNKDRQTEPHPHQVIFHPEREELLIPDLGSDKVRRLAKDEKGDWVQRGEVVYDAGGGPRHIAFYKDVLYTLLELTSEVTAHIFPPLPAEPTFLQKLPTQKHFPGSPAEIGMLAAEILVPKPNSAFPKPYLYLSNRNDPSPEGDIISIYAIADSGKLESVGEVRSGLKHLRGMLFGGPEDKYLVAGGAQGGGVKVFERVDGGKGLKQVAHLAVEAPTSFLWA
ncbi:putative isomerase YbhE [Cristinia sonorae]|uniref:Isomerase YbhE n=1 Tax=Cristinia sonorae TaxID=1940300 RepID=A0A8K0XSA9_9AGAR|nr:putative isomerase YbhE [Cristinia sonorae]